MTGLILHIYDYLRGHSLLRWLSLVLTTVLCGVLVTQQTFREDIADFLPLDSNRQEALQTFQQAQHAGRIYVIFQSADSLDEAPVELFRELFERSEELGDVACKRHTLTNVTGLLSPDDPDVMNEWIGSLYARMPYLLTDEDYARMDTLRKTPESVRQQLEDDKQRLMLPTAGMMALQIGYDPLNLFASVTERLRASALNVAQPEDGHTSTSVRRTMLMVDSPYGVSETEHNGLLAEWLQQTGDSVSKQYPGVSVHLTGGPIIAVGNARQIKTDSMRAVSLAAGIILLLLWLAFRHARNMLLIAFSIGWGWLFAMGCLTMVHQGVSVIVIGISSVIIGIAVNYPLHLIAHFSHTADMRAALKEMAVPLVVGNITTVGAFLALIPLNSAALRDLGLFSAFLLVGTILFVLLWLPHLVGRAHKTPHRLFGALDRIRQEIASHTPTFRLENQQWTVWPVVALTVVLGWFSLQTSFDADLQHINYMTDEQRQDMEYLQALTGSGTQGTQEREKARARWNAWRQQEGLAWYKLLSEQAEEAGFAADSFDGFYHLVHTPPAEDGRSLTASIVDNLSADFNYIGWACGLIVFVFLWCSLGSIELALLSFLPMAVSWIWILGIMALLGIQFNVVNVILATFIFGQGDDYTILMTEGCQYEYAYRRQMLASYKYGIVLSAAIMLAGIGSLAVARHPALFSLAEVTIIGMFSVVLTAWLFPPLVFRWLVCHSDGTERRQPLTLRGMVTRRGCEDWQVVAARYRYRGIEISAPVNRTLRYWRRHGAELERLAQSDHIEDRGWGETALLVALRHPRQQYTVTFKDDERALVARHAMEAIVNNIIIKS